MPHCFSRVWLFVTLWTAAQQASLSLGILDQKMKGLSDGIEPTQFTQNLERFILSNKWTAESEVHIYVLWPLTAVSICLARSSKCCLGNLHCYWLKSSEGFRTVMQGRKLKRRVSYNVNSKALSLIPLISISLACPQDTLNEPRVGELGSTPWTLGLF